MTVFFYFVLPQSVAGATDRGSSVSLINSVESLHIVSKDRYLDRHGQNA